MNGKKALFYIRIALSGVLGFIAMFSLFWVVVIFSGPMIRSAAPYPHIPSVMDSLLLGFFGAAIGITMSLYRPVRKSNISRFVSFKEEARTRR